MAEAAVIKIVVSPAARQAEENVRLKRQFGFIRGNTYLAITAKQYVENLYAGFLKRGCLRPDQQIALDKLEAGLVARQKEAISAPGLTFSVRKE